MAERVYECDQTEAKELKRILSYDPYLDPNIIPKSKDMDEKQLAQMNEEEKKALKEQEAKTNDAIKKLKEDKFLNVIFARQDYDLREGKSMGGDADKSYLWIKAPDEFFAGADERFKRDFKTVKRAPSEMEKKFIELKTEEESKANAGFGAIFGA